MNLLVVGVSYRTAGVEVLERLAAPPQDAPQMLTDLLSQAYVGEAMVLSTCNRVEVYAGVSAFHGGLSEIAAVLAARAGCTTAELAPYLYVHFDGEAVRHAFRVATGLDSMVVGEAQILGQLREAYALATERDTAGRLLHDLMQQALRVGKRAHAETGIDRAGQSVVSAALRLAASNLEPQSIEGRCALVIGAGSMGALALATLRRLGAGRLIVTNRDLARAQRLAEMYDAQAVPLEALASAVADSDIVVCATAAAGHVLTAEHVSGPVVILDLAVPRDVDPAVATMPGVTLIDLELLGTTLRVDRTVIGTDPTIVGRTTAGQTTAGQTTADRTTAGRTTVSRTTVDRTTVGSDPDGRAALGDENAVELIVAAEVEAFRLQLQGAEVAPTLSALRARADQVVASEMQRLRQRRADLTDEQRSDVAHAIHRVVQRLLHEPTVRVRELAAEPGGDRYAELLRELFDLDIPPSAQTAADVPSVLDGDV